MTNFSLTRTLQENREESHVSKRMLTRNRICQLQIAGSAGAATAEIAPTRRFAPSSSNTASATGRNVEDIGRLASLRRWDLAAVRQPIGSTQPAINGDEPVRDGSAKGRGPESSYTFLAR